MRVVVRHGVGSVRGMPGGSLHSLWLWVLRRVREAIQVGVRNGGVCLVSCYAAAKAG
jgi:hypothetical protein